ncbi:MAG: transposase [Planctomycetota bacterium]
MGDGTEPQINLLPIERYWFLTWTTYGSWLPGDLRGFVGEAVDEDGLRRPHNESHSPPAMPSEALAQFSRELLVGPPILLNVLQAKALLEQFLETTRYRRWLLVAVGVMQTHIHAVIGVTGDPKPEKILNDLKSYATRRLNRDWARPVSETWWSRSGSKRKLAGEQDVVAVVEYIHHQPNPLLIWTRERGVVFRVER